MPENHTILDKQPGGWTLIVLLIVVAIIALLMAVYLPSVLQVYTPPTSPGQDGTRKSTLDHIKDQLAPNPIYYIHLLFTVIRLSN